MSHVTSIELEVTDLESLARATEDIGCELVRGQQSFKWWGRHVGDYPLPQGFSKEDMGHCDHAIRVKGNPTAYEVGVCKARTGKGYTLLWDFYAGGQGLQDAVGTGAGKLRQAYAARVAEKKLRAKGYSVTRSIDKQGRVVLVGR